MSTLLPLQTLNSSCWSRVARKRNTCHLAMFSPMHLLFPSPNSSTFSPSSLFTLVPSALRKRSGLKVSGFFQSFLEGRTSGVEMVSPGHGCQGDTRRWELSGRTSLMVCHHRKVCASQDTYSSWFTCHWLTNTQRSFGM